MSVLPAPKPKPRVRRSKSRTRLQWHAAQDRLHARYAKIYGDSTVALGDVAVSGAVPGARPLELPKPAQARIRQG